MEQKMHVQQGSGQSKDGQQMASTAADSSSAVVFDLSVGTSPQTFSVLMDITSELVWVQCDTCSSCISFTSPATPTFLPNKSDSFVEVGCTSQTCQRMIPGPHGCTNDDDPCGYPVDFYAWNTSGVLAADKFTFGTTPVPGVLFGCSGNVMVPDLAGASGVAGFSRGHLSLVSQLNISSFTYFITPPGPGAAASKSFVSWSWGGAADLEFAAQDMLTGPARRSSTPLLAAAEKQNPPGTFDVRANGSGGVDLSTTLPVTYLKESAYNVLRAEFLTRMQSQGVDPVSADDRLCFLTRDFSSAKFPGLALVFDGADATMELKVENYFVVSASGQVTCLTILPSTGGSVLGSLLQSGRAMTYDIRGGQLSFQTAAAGALAPARASLVIMVTLVACLLGQ